MKKFGKLIFRSESGSVLMEFVIVMPIYFLLLGYAFVVGELSLHSIHLSASGDRNVAMSMQDYEDAKFWRVLRRVMSPNREAMKRRDSDPDETDLKFSYEGDLVYEGEDSVSKFDETLDGEDKARNSVLPTSNKGHWTEAVAGRARDNYTLSPITRGFIAHWFYDIEQHVYDGDLMTEKTERPSEKDSVGNILDKDRSTLGRAEMKGNYYEDNEGKKIRDYGYFCLRRKDLAREKPEKKYRTWDAGKLAADAKVTGDGESRTQPAWQIAAISGEGIHEEVAEFPHPDDFYIRTTDSGGNALEIVGPGGPHHVEYDFPELL